MLEVNSIYGGVIALITAVGAISAIILYFLNKRGTNVSILKTTVEIDQLQHEIEVKHAQQVKQWLLDLEEIKGKYDAQLSKKDEVLSETHRQYLETIKQLVESQIRLDRFNRATRRLVTSMEVPYWECDSKGSLIYVNGSWLEMFGLTPKEAYGEGWLQAVPESEQQHLMVDWFSRITDQREEPIEFNIKDPNTGEIITLRSIYALIYEDRDMLNRVIGVTVRVTKDL